MTQKKLAMNWLNASQIHSQLTSLVLLPLYSPKHIKTQKSFSISSALLYIWSFYSIPTMGIIVHRCRQ